MNGRACSFVRVSAVRMCPVQYPYGAWAWAACSPPRRANCAWVAVALYIMNGRVCLFMRASAVRMCTVPVLGLGMAAYSLPDGMYGQNLYWGLCATFSRLDVRYSVRLGQCEQCILYVYVCVCVYGGRHVHPERCTTFVASLFSWRCLAASSYSFLHAAINLRPPSVTASTHISALDAIAFAIPSYAKRPDVALYAIGPPFLLLNLSPLTKVFSCATLSQCSSAALSQGHGCTRPSGCLVSCTTPR